MSQTLEQIKEVEISLEEAQKIVELAKTVERLIANKDFQKIVDEGYFNKEAARLAHIYTDPNPAMIAVKDNIHNDLCGVGSFKRYLQTILIQGRNMEIEIQSSMNTLEELRQEEFDEQSFGGDIEE